MVLLLILWCFERNSSLKWVLINGWCNCVQLSDAKFLLNKSFSNRFLLTCRTSQIQPKHLSCVSLSCLHMAAKVTEECNLAPTDELIRIGQCRFTVSDLSRMEKIVTEKLNFKSKAITALTFLHLYHQIALSHSTDRWGVACRKPFVTYNIL